MEGVLERKHFNTVNQQSPTTKKEGESQDQIAIQPASQQVASLMQ